MDYECQSLQIDTKTRCDLSVKRREFYRGAVLCNPQ